MCAWQCAAPTTPPWRTKKRLVNTLVSGIPSKQNLDCGLTGMHCARRLHQ